MFKRASQVQQRRERRAAFPYRSVARLPSPCAERTVEKRKPPQAKQAARRSTPRANRGKRTAPQHRPSLDQALANWAQSPFWTLHVAFRTLIQQLRHCRATAQTVQLLQKHVRQAEHWMPSLEFDERRQLRKGLATMQDLIRQIQARQRAARARIARTEQEGRK